MSFNIYFYDSDDNVLKVNNYDDSAKDLAIKDFNDSCNRFKCPNFYGKLFGSKVKSIELCQNGSSLTKIDF